MFNEFGYFMSDECPGNAFAVGSIVVLAKFAAVAAAALVSGILSLVGMLWPFYVKLSAFSWMTEGGAAFTGFQIASMALVLVPLSAMGAGILLTISTIARNQKEAQTWLGPVMMVVSVLSMMSMMMFQQHF